MNHFEINFDARKILVNDQWYTLEELGQEIKESITRGNYKIKKWSEASEQLQTFLENSKKISFIIPTPLYDNYLKLSQQREVGLEILLKQALESYLVTPKGITNIQNDQKKYQQKSSKEEVPQKATNTLQTVKTDQIKNTDYTPKEEPIIIEEIIVQKKGSKEKEQPPVIVNSRNSAIEDEWFA